MKEKSSESTSLQHGNKTDKTDFTNTDERSRPSEELPSDENEQGHYHLPETNHSISLLPLAVLVFYNVSGGPFGIEPTVRSAGALFAILGFIIFPIVWSIPEALVTAELGSAFPCSSGGVAWVEEAFGYKAGAVMGYLSYVSGTTDNGIYPVLFLEYLLEVYNKGDDSMSHDVHSVLRFVLVVGLAFVLTLINYSGLKFVGNMNIFIALISMSPFIIMCIWGIPQINPNRWLVLPDPNTPSDNDTVINQGWLPDPHIAGVNWRVFLNNLFWNLNSFDSGAYFVLDVQDMATYYKAMIISIFIVIASYFFPLFIALGATDTIQADWVDGYLATACTKIVGPWLGKWTVVAAGISNLALFEAEMSADAWQIAGMAERGIVPKIFKTRSRFGTPKYGIMLGFIIIVVMTTFDFSTLVEMLNFNYTISLLMEYAAFIKLRISKGDVHRPYQVPFGTCGCILLILPACSMMILLLCMASYKTYIYFFGFAILGLTGQFILELAKHRNWCEFVTKIPVGQDVLNVEFVSDAVYKQTQTVSTIDDSDSAMPVLC